MCKFKFAILDYVVYHEKVHKKKSTISKNLIKKYKQQYIPCIYIAAIKDKNLL
jgi:hypothetical protein